MKLYVELEVVKEKPRCKVMQTQLPQININSVPDKGLDIGMERDQLYSVSNMQGQFIAAYDIKLDAQTLKGQAAKLLAQTSQPRSNDQPEDLDFDFDMDYEGYDFSSEDFDELYKDTTFFDDEEYDKYV